MSRSSTSIDRGEIVAEGRRLRRLAMGVGDDQRRLLALGDVDQRRRAAPRPCASSASMRGFSAELEQRVVDVVARARRVQAAGDVGPEPRLQLLLDEEEEILDLAGVDRASPGSISRSMACKRARRSPRACCASRMPVSASMTRCARSMRAEAVDMMRLGAVEQRPQHRLLVDRIGEDARVGERADRLQSWLIPSARPA